MNEYGRGSGCGQLQEPCKTTTTLLPVGVCIRDLEDVNQRVNHVAEKFGLHRNCKRLVTTVQYFINTTFTEYANTITHTHAHTHAHTHTQYAPMLEHGGFRSDIDHQRCVMEPSCEASTAG